MESEADGHCADCGEPIYFPDIGAVEAFEMHGRNLCQYCFDDACEAEDDE